MMTWGRLGLLDAIFLSLLACSCTYYILSTLFLWVHRARRRAIEDLTTPVSVLKPLAGQVPGLERALESIFLQNHSNYQVIFGIRTETDPARDTVEALMRKYPQADATLVVAGPPIGPNRKVTNLHYMLEHAKHDLIVVSDDDVVAPNDYLSRAAGELADRSIGISTASYWVRPDTLPSALHSLTIATEFFPSVAVARIPDGGLWFALGAASIVKHHCLDEIGGFRDLGDYLADDYQLGRMARQMGWQVLLSQEKVELTDRYQNLSDFLVHQMRWTRTYRVCQPVGFFFSFVTQGIGLAALYVAFSLASPLALAAGGVVLALRLVASVAQIAANGPIDLLKWVWLVPFRDILSLGFWASSWAGRMVHWRSDRFRLAPGGRLERVS
jgi:ceramide glucosyltransferase